jgi:hypothetical protein
MARKQGGKVGWGGRTLVHASNDARRAAFPPLPTQLLEYQGVLLHPERLTPAVQGAGGPLDHSGVQPRNQLQTAGHLCLRLRV